MKPDYIKQQEASVASPTTRPKVSDSRHYLHTDYRLPLSHSPRSWLLGQDTTEHVLKYMGPNEKAGD